MARTLVTGATGFIGSHLVDKLLSRGDRVRCLVRSTSSLDWLPTHRVELARGDVALGDGFVAAAVADCEIVYHLAGLTKALDREQLFRCNAAGVRNIVRVCASAESPPTLVVVSSLAAAGPSSSIQPREEADPPHPVSLYGSSKRAGELAAAEFARSLPISIVRPAIVLGERDRAGCELFRSIARFGVHIVPSYEQRRFALMHADDLAEALILVAERGGRLTDPEADGQLAAGIYFAADEEQPTYSELGHLLARAIGRRSVLTVPLPEAAVLAIGGLSDVVGRATHRPPAFSLDKACEATAGNWTCSVRRLHDDLGFRPAASLSERLHQTADWYRDAGWL